MTLHEASLSRRDFNSILLAGAAQLALPRVPAKVIAEKSRPLVAQGVASGDLTGTEAVIWSRADRPARMFVEWASTPSFKNSVKVSGPAALPEGDFTAKTILTNLPPGEDIFYRVRFEDLSDLKTISHVVEGRFRNPPQTQRSIRFVWSGDTAGQGFGINSVFGGMPMYKIMGSVNPDFFIHSGDYVYSDIPIPAQLKLEDGTTWNNVVTPEKSKVAETQAEFWGQFRYNLMSQEFRDFNAATAQFVQWDDHETHNNWSPGAQIEDERYNVRSVELLAARAKRAFFDYIPVMPQREDAERIYSNFRYGPALEIFRLDMRSYRGTNSENQQSELNEESAYLGNEQLSWLKAALMKSTATWKVIAADMPLGLIVQDGPKRFENSSNGDGPPLGRELEIAHLLRFIKQCDIRNVVWLTADVHYAAAHHYDPARAVFKDFLPFWEFVAGPIHAGTFGPNKLDNTFGPEVRFKSVPDDLKQNRPPTDGLQFFGVVDIDGKTETLTVSLRNLKGQELYSVDLIPARA